MASATAEKRRPEEKRPEEIMLTQFADILKQALDSRKPFTSATLSQYEKAGLAARAGRQNEAMLGTAPSKVAKLVVSKTTLGEGVANKESQVAAIKLAEQIETGKPNFSDWVNRRVTG